MRKSRMGFSLLEMIITFTVVAVLSSMFLTFFGDAFERSTIPATQLKSILSLQKVLENILGDTNTLTAIQARVGDEGEAQDNFYGVYHVVRNRFVRFDATNTEIDDATGTNNLLKVTIQSRLGEMLTILLTD